MFAPPPPPVFFLKQTGEDGFTVTPDELSLRVGEEKSVVVTFKAQHGWKYRDG